MLLWQKNCGGTGWWGLILSKYHLQNFWQGGRQRWSVQGIRGNDQTNTNRFGISNAIDNLSCNFLIKREKRLKNWATELCPLIINIIDKSLWKFCVILAKYFERVLCLWFLECYLFIRTYRLYISYFIISLSCTYSLVIFQFFVLLFWLDEIEVKKTILSLSELPALSVLQVIKLTGRKNKNAIPINFL